MKTSDGFHTAGGWRLVHFFGLLGSLVALPALLFSAYLIARFAALERESGEARLEDTVRALNASIEREVSFSIVTLRLLATSPSLEDGDLGAFHRRAQTALQGSEAYVLLVDKDAQQLLNTRVPYGTPLGPSSDPEPVALALQTGRAVVSGVFFGKVAERYVYNVIVPAKVADRGNLALILTRDVDSLADILSDSIGGSDAVMTVVDGSGRVVVSRAAGGVESGQQIAPERLAAFAARDGLVRWNDPENGRQIVAYARSDLTGWTSSISLPEASFNAPFDGSWRMLAATGLLLLLLTGSMTLLLGRLLALPFEGIARDAEALGRGEAVALRSTPLREANKVVTALHHASLERQDHQQHIELLMRELTHRAKNLVAVVQAIASLTARNSSSKEAFLDAFKPRLVAFGRSIDLLAGRNWKGLPLRDLIAAQICTFSADASAQFAFDGPDVVLKPIAAERLGMALHELSTNAVKYGALGTQAGRVSIAWHIDRQPHPIFTMTWAESGGPPPVRSEIRGFGHQLTVVMPAQSLRGSVDTSFGPEGFRWALTCPAHMVSSAYPNPAGRPGTEA